MFFFGSYLLLTMFVNITNVRRHPPLSDGIMYGYLLMTRTAWLFNKPGNSRGICGGFAGDAEGIWSLFGGFAANRIANKRRF